MPRRSRSTYQGRAKAKSAKQATQFDSITIALTERTNKASHPSAADCKSRRLGILNGKTLAFTEYGITRHRDNSQYGIILTDGTKMVANL